MLCKDKIAAIFCIIDDILKEIYPIEDKRRKISDSQVVFTAVLAAKNFYGNHSSAIRFVKEYGMIPNMLDESRFNRRLHRLGEFSSKFLNSSLRISKKFLVKWNILLIHFLSKFVKIFALIVQKLLKENNGEAIRQVCEPTSMGLRFN